jgi:thiamine-phosphate pyrophosphorylase
LNKPLLYLITDRQQFTPHPHHQLDAIAAAAQAGCQLIQIREKDLSARELCEFVRAAIAKAKPHGAQVLVNDRVDVACAAGADGVHLRVNSLPAAEVRRIVPRRDFLIGVSTHSLTEAHAAQTNGADFIVCGPVFPTLSKAEFGAPLGLDRLAEICHSVQLPVLALGGITMGNFAEPLACGAAGIAAISLFKNLTSLGSNIKIVLSSRLNPQD